MNKGYRTGIGMLEAVILILISFAAGLSHAAGAAIANSPFLVAHHGGTPDADGDSDRSDSDTSGSSSSGAAAA